MQLQDNEQAIDIVARELWNVLDKNLNPIRSYESCHVNSKRKYQSVAKVVLSKVDEFLKGGNI
jgi:hypothetical protein